MKKENEKVVHIEEVDGMPFINWSTAKLIVEKDLVFEWKNRCFKLRHVEGRTWAVCFDCKLGIGCTRGEEAICVTFDQHLGGCNWLELV